MRFSWIPLLAVLTLAVAGALGCSKAECDSSRCAAGNQCIDDGSGSGATCHKVCKRAADCPANWYCNDGLAGGGTTSWCVANTMAYTPGKGQWGDPCRATAGEGANPDCDWSQGFACYGTSPTDADTFCTQFACASDGDCPGGWWCSTQNIGPNVTSPVETVGKTRQICLPRKYCAPCKKDLDCFAPPGAPPMHCVPDTNGSNFCSPECTSDSSCSVRCPPRAPPSTRSARRPGRCARRRPRRGRRAAVTTTAPLRPGTYQHCLGGRCTPECSSASDCAGTQTCVTNVNVCEPRAGVCVGDGTLCSPCRSDDDCAPKTPALGAAPPAPGLCLTAAFSSERFCTAAATVDACDASATDPAGCPLPQSGQPWTGVACIGAPQNQCYGLVTFGTSTGSPMQIPGCWSVNR